MIVIYGKLLENSIELALNDGSIDYVFATGNFNDNQLNQQNSRIKTLLTQFSMTQLNEEPTYFTEHSSSIYYLPTT